MTNKYIYLLVTAIAIICLFCLVDNLTAQVSIIDTTIVELKQEKVAIDNGERINRYFARISANYDVVVIPYRIFKSMEKGKVVPIKQKVSVLTGSVDYFF
jgi:uncharacterized oligopeptide transporter (OPT) family protein